MGTSTATATTTAIIVPEDNEPDSHVISLEKLCLSEAFSLDDYVDSDRARFYERDDAATAYQAATYDVHLERLRRAERELATSSATSSPTPSPSPSSTTFPLSVRSRTSSRPSSRSTSASTSTSTSTSTPTEMTAAAIATFEKMARWAGAAAAAAREIGRMRQEALDIYGRGLLGEHGEETEEWRGQALLPDLWSGTIAGLCEARQKEWCARARGGDRDDR